MKVKVNAVLETAVQVNITPIDALYALADAFGVKDIIKENDPDADPNVYWTVVKDPKGDYLQYYKNRACHGTPVFEPVDGKVIRKYETVEAYKHLICLKKLMK